MAGGVNINGQIIRVPGIYGTYDADALGGALPSVGNLALVGSFPILEANTPKTVTNQQAFKALNPSSPEILQLAKLCFNPANDSRISGAATVTLVNATPNTQAYRILNDANGNGSIKVKAKLWGTAGNKVAVAVGCSSDNKLLDIAVSSNGTSETYRSLGSGNVASFHSSCTELRASTPVGADVCALDVNRAGSDYSKACNNLQWRFSRGMWQLSGGSPIALPKNTPYTFVGNKLPVTGKLSMVLNADVPAGQSCVLTVTGEDSEGNAVTATATAPEGSQNRDAFVLKDGVTEVQFSRIDTMEWDGTGTSPAVARVMNVRPSGTLTPGAGYSLRVSIEGTTYDTLYGTPESWSLSVGGTINYGTDVLEIDVGSPSSPYSIPTTGLSTEAEIYTAAAAAMSGDADVTVEALPAELRITSKVAGPAGGSPGASWSVGAGTVSVGVHTPGTLPSSWGEFCAQVVAKINAAGGDTYFTASEHLAPSSIDLTAKVAGTAANSLTVSASWVGSGSGGLVDVTQTQAGASGGGGGGYATPPNLAGSCFDLDLSPGGMFNSVADVVAYFAPLATAGFSVSAESPKVAGIPSDQLDQLLAADTLVATAHARADIWAILQALTASNLISAERVQEADSGIVPPAPWGTSGTIHKQLSGGTQASMSPSSFEDALASITHKAIQTVVATHTTDVLNAQALANHCVQAAIAGYERNGYAAAEANQSIAAVRSGWVNQLNTRHVSILAQQPQLANPLTGAVTYWDTWYSAVIAGAMQSGRNIGIPLTNKKPNALGFKQAWTLGLDDNEVISAGIYAFTLDDTGYKVLRSITTWVTDDNPVYAEVSANESGNYTVRDLRSNLKQKIGDPALLGPSQFKGIVSTILDAQVAGGFITSWLPESLAIVKVADKYSIDYDFVPVFPFNFGIVHAHALAG